MFSKRKAASSPVMFALKRQDIITQTYINFVKMISKHLLKHKAKLCRGVHSNRKTKHKNAPDLDKGISPHDQKEAVVRNRRFEAGDIIQVANSLLCKHENLFQNRVWKRMFEIPLLGRQRKAGPWDSVARQSS